MSRLNVFKYQLRPWKYPRNWIPNIIRFFKNFRYAYDRATKGYCEFDLWELCSFYQELFYSTINAFSKSELHGAPVDLYDESLDDEAAPWKEYLTEMATHFYNSISTNEVQLNEYDTRVNFGLFQRPNTEEQQELREKWLAREEQIMLWQDSEFHKAMNMFMLHFYDLWY